MRFKALLLIILFASMGILPMLPSNAVGEWPKPNDFAMNFDNFATGTLNPYPFTQIGSHGVGTGVSYFGVFGCSTWCSAPNVYALGTPANGTVSLQANFNATGYKAVATIQSNCINSYLAGDTAIFTLKDSVMSNATKVQSATGHCQATGNSILYNATVSTIPGQNVLVNFTWVSGNGQQFIYLDNFQILYGSVIISNYNFELYNASSAGPWWFDPSQYAGSQLIVNYPSSTNNSAQWPNAPTSGLSIPDVKYNLLNTATLVTLYVGGVYSRTLIPPPSPQTMAMYVDNPSSVQAFKITVQAPPGYYGQGSDIFIIMGGHNVTSGYLDSTQSFSTYLVPGAYTVTLNDGLHSQTQIQTFSSTTSAITINGYAINTPQNANGVSSLHWTAGFNSTATGIIFNYWDNTSTTTSLGLQVKIQNGSGTYLAYSHVYTVSTPFVSVTVPANSNLLNKNLSQYLYAYVSISSSYYGGNYSLGSQSLWSCPSCFFPTPLPSFPGSVGGFASIFPNINWLNILGMTVILFTGGGFGLFQAKIGAVVTPAIAGLMSLAGILTVDPTVITTLIALGVLGALSWYRRTP